MTTTKKNISLILAISIPILMILFIAGSIYLPGLFIKPQYNFLYAIENNPADNSNNGYQYSVQNHKLLKNKITQLKNSNRHPPQSKLYIYDVSKNESKEISFEDAQKLNLNSKTKSPDDFEIAYGNRDDGFFIFFFGPDTDYSTRYLRGHGASQKLNIELDSNSNYNNFHFIGWIQ